MTVKLCAYCDRPARGLIIQNEYEIEPGVLAVEDLDVCAKHSGLPEEILANLAQEDS